MTRRRFSKIQKAVIIWVVNKSTDPLMKKLNKVVYSADFASKPGKHDWLRTTKLYTYQNAYDSLLKDSHKRMIEERRNEQ